MQKYTGTIYVFNTNSLVEHKSDIRLESCLLIVQFIYHGQRKGVKASTKKYY